LGVSKTHTKHTSHTRIKGIKKERLFFKRFFITTKFVKNEPPSNILVLIVGQIRSKLSV